MSNALMIVSNRLPVTLTPEGAIRSAGGLVSALDGARLPGFKAKWLGWPGGDVPVEDRDQVIQTLKNGYGCVPVFIPERLAAGHYEGQSNSSIWPLFHSMPTYFQYRAEWWDAYRRVNGLFAEEVLRNVRPNDVVWVHDYHLMLLPRLLKRSMPTLKVGFFLHTPFPSSDIFRCHPNREELLAGVLGSDLIGFHTFGYLRHFRSSVLRVLGIESEMTTVHHDGGSSTLGVYPIGIDAERFARETATAAFAERCAANRRSYGARRIVLSVERLDYTKGIIRRLDAIELFLSRLTPSDRDRVQFVFVSVPTRGGADGYRTLRETVERRVGHINGLYATLAGSPIHFLHQSVGFEDLCALYGTADVALVTPLIDGMNLVAKEFVACQQLNDAENGARDAGNGGRGPGVLVLSEFAGAAQEFPNALTVNPYDVSGVADALLHALNMPAEERRRRMLPMRDRVYLQDAAAWAEGFVGDLSARPKGQVASTAGLIEARRRLRDAVVGRRPVAVILDYDGTIREIVQDPATAVLTPEAAGLLEALAARDFIDVTVISGRTISELTRFLGHHRFGLVCEHGAEVRMPGSDLWTSMDPPATTEWKYEVCRILQVYQHNTPGTHIEIKRTGVVWHYRRADPEFGSWKAKQLVDELSNVAANNPIQVRHGKKIVEICGAHVNKGAAVLHVLGDKRYDLILLAGDDATDESMFQLAASDPRMLTFRIGDGETRAQFRLPTPAALRSFIQSAMGRGQNRTRTGKTVADAVSGR